MTADSVSFDRRRFLSAGVAAVSLSSLPNLLRADEKKEEAFGGFKLGAQSYTFREFDLEPALKRMKDLDLHYVELFNKHAPLNSSPEQIAALVKLCKVSPSALK